MRLFRFAALLLALWPAAALALAPPDPPPGSVVASGPVSLAVTSSSANVALTADTGTFAFVTIVNVGSNEIFCQDGGVAVTASTSAYHVSVPAGQYRTFWGAGNGYVACVTATSTSTARISQSNGAQQLGSLGGGSGGGSTGVVSFNTRTGAVVPVAGDYSALPETLTSKTINGPDNTLTNIANASLINSSLTVAGHSVSLGGSTNLASTDLTDTGNLARSTNNLSFFAATTSAQLASILSDETGTGPAVFATSPSLVTPSLGAALATSINGVTIPVTTDTVDLLGATQTITGVKTFAGVNASYTATLFRNDSSPAAHAIGNWNFDSNNSTLAQTTFVQLRGASASVTAGSELGQALFGVMGGQGIPGTVSTMISLTGGASVGAAVFNIPAGISVTMGTGLTAEGSGKLNVASGIYSNNLLAIDSSDNGTFASLVVGASPVFTINSSGNAFTSATAGPQLRNVSTTSTTPTLLPRRDSVTGGIGADVANDVSLIASSVEVERITSIEAIFFEPIGFASILASPTAPTISSGFGTSPSIADNNGTAVFTVNVGTGGTASSGVIGLPTATKGWHCLVNDRTTTSAAVSQTKQTNSALSTTSCTIGNFTDLSATGPWASGDLLTVHAFAD